MPVDETVSLFPLRDIRDRALEGAKVERGFFLFVMTLVLAFLITSAATNVVESPSNDVILTMWEVRETYGSNTWTSSVERLSKSGCSAGASRFQFLEAVMCISLVISAINIYFMLMEYLEKPVIRRAALICFVLTTAAVAITWVVSFLFMYTTICSNGARGTLNYTPASKGFVFGASFAALSCALGLLGFCFLIFIARRIHDRHQESRELGYIERRRLQRKAELDALGEEEIIELDDIGAPPEKNSIDEINDGVAEALRKARLEADVVEDIQTDVDRRGSSVRRDDDSNSNTSIALGDGEGLDLGYTGLAIDSPPKSKTKNVPNPNKTHQKSESTTPLPRDTPSSSAHRPDSSSSGAMPTSPSSVPSGSKMRAVFTTTNRNQPKKDGSVSDSPPTSSRRRRESELSIQSTADQVNRFSPVPNQNMAFHHTHDHNYDTDVGGSSFSKPPRPPGSGNDGLRASPSAFYRLGQPSRSSIAFTESSADRTSVVATPATRGYGPKSNFDTSVADLYVINMYERPVSRQPDVPMAMSGSVSRNFGGSKSAFDGESSLRRKRSKSIMFLEDESYSPRGEGVVSPISPLVRHHGRGNNGSFSSPVPAAPILDQPHQRQAPLFSPRPGSGPPKRTGAATAGAPASRPDSASQLIATRPPSANAPTNNYQHSSPGKHNNNNTNNSSFSSAEGVAEEETIVLEEAVPSAAFQRPITPQKVLGVEGSHFSRNMVPQMTPPTASAPILSSTNNTAPSTGAANRRPAHLKLYEDEGVFDFGDDDFS